jgi:UDP:flavonoid glycosyltransferase YjiC (YdhE family)
MPSPHLLVAISSHGFGHATQTAPVLNALRRRRPDLRLTVATGVPRALLEERIDGPFELIERRSDFGMAMTSAIEIDIDASARRYEAIHLAWPAAVQAEADWLAAIRPDLLLSNVAYLPLAAAERTGIPAIALSSLHWAAIHRHYLLESPGGVRTQKQIEEAYASARAFVPVTPNLEAAFGNQTAAVGPVARLGRARRSEILARLDRPEDIRMVLVSSGGVAFPSGVARLPRIDGVVWLYDGAEDYDRHDIRSPRSLGLPFIDIQASADALLTKLGYSTVVEAGCLGIPLLHLPRGDWPEERPLTEWLRRHAPVQAVVLEDLRSGAMADRLEVLWAAPRPEPAVPSGAEEAAEILLEYLP